MAEFSSLPLPDHQVVIAAALAVPKAQDFAAAVNACTFGTLVECLKVGAGNDPFFRPGDEILVFDLSPQVGQRPVNDIRFIERIAVHFDAKDHNIPWVYALRADFPKVLHRNALYFEQPPCLCIYEHTYEEMKIEWRSVKFLHDIGRWLELTAEDKLHQDGQPLEPFLVSNMGTIIVPPDYKADETLHIYGIAQKANRLSLVASRIELRNQEPYQAQVILLKGDPQAHGVMGITPNNLASLHTLLLPAGIDLMAVIKQKLHELPKTAAGMEQRLMIFLELPKTGQRAGTNENDYYVFLTAENADDIGLQMRLLEKDPERGLLGNVLFEAIDVTLGAVLIIGALLPQVQLTPDWALLLSGNARAYDVRETKIFQIGTGALGSQFFMNNARSGFGRWVLTDHDFMMPHNLVRHASDMTYMGNFKSFGLAVTANQMFGGENFADPLSENYLYPANEAEFTARLAEAAVIVDVSTSIAVARHLAARTDISGRRISLFLSPNGHDLVILAEDSARNLSLDRLEYQYYQQLVAEPALNGHLQTEQGIRLSTSCRDITARIAQDHVAIHAGIASAQIRSIIKQVAAFTGIWRLDPQSMAVTPYIFEPQQDDVWEIEGWTISLTHHLVNKIATARLAKLPNETGGILIGGYDLERKKIYLTDTILSPSDSEEYPTAYIRGTDGVESSLNDYREKTADHLKYAGEWHSHPKGYSLRPSNDDQILFRHIHDEMQALGFPTLMIIAGDDKTYELYFQP